MIARDFPPSASKFIRAKRAVFLDRDGVLNRNVFYGDTQKLESPREPESLILTETAGSAMRRLRRSGFRLVLVSNQPNAAKGKCSRDMLDQIHLRLISLLAAEGVGLDACYYCYHHPEHGGRCACRKPDPAFLREEALRSSLDLSACWMIGDRASDIECGQTAGTRTIWIDNHEDNGGPGQGGTADLTASNLGNAVTQLLSAAALSSATD